MMKKLICYLSAFLLSIMLNINVLQGHERNSIKKVGNLITSNKLTINCSNYFITGGVFIDYFPNNEFDSVYYIDLRVVKIDKNRIYKKEDLGLDVSIIRKKGILIHTKVVKKILEVVNDSISFDYGECGTPFLNSAIIFFKGDKIIDYIVITCGYSQLFFLSNNNKAKSGLLSRIGFKKFSSIIRRIERKYTPASADL